MSKGLYTALAVVLVLVIAAGSFYGGMLFGKSQAVASATAQRAAFAAGNLPPGAQAFGAPGETGARGAGAGNMVIGAIKEIGDGSLILTDSNGKDIPVKVTDTTLIEKNASVKLTDLAPGETLMVSGSAAADGSITARSLQVAPQGRFGPAGANLSPGDPNAPNARPTPAQ